MTIIPYGNEQNITIIGINVKLQLLGLYSSFKIYKGLKIFKD